MNCLDYKLVMTSTMSPFSLDLECWLLVVKLSSAVILQVLCSLTMDTLSCARLTSPTQQPRYGRVLHGTWFVFSLNIRAWHSCIKLRQFSTREQLSPRILGFNMLCSQ